MEDENKLKRISGFLSEYSTTLMAVGVQTSRVVKNTSRIAEAFGIESDMTIFQKTIIMTLRDNKNGKTFSSVNKIRPMALNFFINSKLSTLSWDIYDNKLSIQESENRFNDIINVPREKDITVLILVAIANASFCRLFQGDFISMAIVFFATLIGFGIRQILMKRHWNHLAVFLISSFTASMAGSTGFLMNWGATPEVALGTSVLFLIPGVPMINTVMDIIDGHVLSGISRFINATLLVIAIAIGISLTLAITKISAL